MKFVRVALCLAVVVASATTARAQAQKPNVIIFLADDMGIGDVSAYIGKKLSAGSAPIGVTTKTPNLERLAQMGAVFTDVHSSSTMCSTSRYSLLTGRYAARSFIKTTTVQSNWTGAVMLDQSRQTLGHLFDRAGYETSMIGKYHLTANMLDHNGNRYVGNAPVTKADFDAIRWPTAANPNVESIADGPLQHGFDYFYGTLSNNFTFNRSEFNGYFENNTLQGIPTWPAVGDPGGVTPTVGPADWDPAYAGERLANKALARIDQHVATHNGTPGNPAKPLFMYYAPLSNHTTYIAPPSMTIQGETHEVTGKGKLTSGQDGSSREDLVWENDVVIGELIDKLQATIDPATGQPMINNTILIVSSDNGADHPNPVFSAGLRDRKQSIYEGGHRVPFIASWPGHIPAGSVSNQTFGHTDLYATFAGMLGEDLAMTEAEDSENIMPALLGQTPAQFTRPGFMVNHDDSLNSSAADIPNGAVLALRSGSMKLILTRDLVNVPNQPGGPNGQAIPLALFDLSNDVGESVNLVNNPQYAPLIQQLSSTALRYYNQGFSRSTLQSPYGALVREDGGADLANNLGGSVGYEFTVGAQPVLLTRLGMWDDGAGDIINQETNALNPDGDTVGTPDGLATGHWVRLFDKTSGTQLASVQVTTANSIVEGEFRYVTLPASISLAAGAEYALTMSTASGDGDMFHIPAPFSGRSPIPTSSLVNFESRRSTTDGVYPTLLPNGETATGAATESQFMHRFYVGPTATLAASLPVLQAADFNADGAVDGADFVIWQRGLGLTGATRADGDADSNGLVNAADLTIWRQAMSTPGSAGSVRGVPEPSGVALVGMVVAALGAGVVRPRHAGRGGCAGCRS